MYQNGEYMEKNPTWHVEDSPWKAKHIIKMLNANNIKPASICDIGCGAGEILNQLHHHLPSNIEFFGYEISPQAFTLCQKRKKERLCFFLGDLFEDNEAFFDLVLAIDVIEHIENMFQFLRKMKKMGKYKIFHFPLDLSAKTIIQNSPIMEWRKDLGHIHYFTKETSLAALKDTGYEIIDSFYGKVFVDFPNHGFKSSLLNLTRKILFPLKPDLTVRLFGGFSLFVLAK